MLNEAGEKRQSLIKIINREANKFMSLNGDGDDIELELECYTDSFSFQSPKVIFFLAFVTNYFRDW